MRDLNFARYSIDRTGEHRRAGKEIAAMVDGWGLIDIWDAKHKQEYGHKAHTWYLEQQKGCSARFDYAVCNNEPFVKGIRLDKERRILVQTIGCLWWMCVMSFRLSRKASTSSVKGVS